MVAFAILHASLGHLCHQHAGSLTVKIYFLFESAGSNDFGAHSSRFFLMGWPIFIQNCNTAADARPRQALRPISWLQEAQERDAAAKKAQERAAEEYAAEAKKMAAIAAAAPKPAPPPKEKTRPARNRNRKKQNAEDDFWVRLCTSKEPLQSYK